MPGIVSTSVLERLWRESNSPQALENSSMKFWQYWVKNCVFHESSWVVSTAQPVIGMPGDQTKVDLIVQGYSVNRPYPVVLFLEAKKPSSEPAVVIEVETQAYEACQIFLETYKDELHVWAATILGTKCRVWFNQKGDPWLTAFVPITLLSVGDEYVDAFSTDATKILHAFQHIHARLPPPTDYEPSPRPAAVSSGTEFTPGSPSPPSEVLVASHALAGVLGLNVPGLQSSSQPPADKDSDTDPEISSANADQVEAYHALSFFCYQLLGRERSRRLKTWILEDEYGDDHCEGVEDEDDEAGAEELKHDYDRRNQKYCNKREVPLTLPRYSFL